MFMYEEMKKKLLKEKSYKYLYAPGSPTTEKVHMCEDVKKHAFH